MKHPSIRELYDYWNVQRGRRCAPERDAIDPGSIRRALADTFILAFDPGMGHPFRLAGTRVCALFTRELKGEPFLKLWAKGSRPLMRDLFSVVASESIGIAAGVTGQTGESKILELELLVLPLMHRGQPNARVLGALAPITTPYWIGLAPVTGLTLGALRYVGTAADSPPSLRSEIHGAPAVDRRASVELAAEVPTGPSSRGRPRNGLVVYDGGRRE